MPAVLEYSPQSSLPRQTEARSSPIPWDGRKSRRSHRHEGASRLAQLHEDAIMAAVLQAEEEAHLLDRSIRSAMRENEARRMRDQTSSPAPPAPRFTSLAPSSLRASDRERNPPKKPKSPAEALRDHSYLFIGERTCWRCKNIIHRKPTSKNDALSSLHAACSFCGATQCRACSKPAPCMKFQCRGGLQCPLARGCCAELRAISLFEILCDFDKTYLDAAANLSGTDTWPVPQAEREDFVELVTSRADRSVSSKLNHVLLDALHGVNAYLSPESPTTEVHPAFPPMLCSSLVFEAVHGFLREESHTNWVVNGDIYSEIMKLVKLLFNRASLRDFVTEPLPAIRHSSGIQAWMWHRGHSVWEAHTRGHESLHNAVFSGGSQQAIARLDATFQRADLKSITASLRRDFQEIQVRSWADPALP
ncbi:hypothetical protein Hypma_003962 [Hypsizygus marmoreus]|uniref:Uncharacterized protein n=1 Tax=Hypsizygus marmoreus TaxID=39966 RepID=A0A369JA38_HYPMA|nr:hypothetical protein Hypma_003962 [Hypsizygus marmoreus]